MRYLMEFHEMDVTGRVITRWSVEKVFRENYIDLQFEHISSKHTNPQKLTLQAGRRVKGTKKNDM